jgi:hypothetical protein
MNSINTKGGMTIYIHYIMSLASNSGAEAAAEFVQVTKLVDGGNFRRAQTRRDSKLRAGPSGSVRPKQCATSTHLALMPQRANTDAPAPPKNQPGAPSATSQLVEWGHRLAC